MKLKDWSESVGVKYITAYRWFKAGILPVKAYQTQSGTIIVDDIQETNATDNISSDALSLFLKKTVEFSKNNSSIEDFAAYVISNFQLKINNTSESPKYSKQKPKSEDVQKHFQQFITKNDKPKPSPFSMEPFKDDDFILNDMSIPNTVVNHDDLVKDFTEAVSYGSLTSPKNYAQEMFPNNSMFVSTPEANIESISSESMVTPQPINYTGSNSPAFSSLLSSSFDYSSIGRTDGVVTNNAVPGGIVSQDTISNTAMPDDTKSTPPRSKRGRKPNKR